MTDVGKTAETRAIVNRLDAFMQSIDRQLHKDKVDLVADAIDKIERLGAKLKEANETILELQQEACDRAGVPMPSQRSVVDKLREDNKALVEALRAEHAANDAMADFIITKDPASLGEPEWRRQHTALIERAAAAKRLGRAALAQHGKP